MANNNQNSAPSKGKAAKLSGSELAAQFMDQLQHPLKPEIEVVRELIASSHPGLSEHIKWNAPSFQYEGEDRITFQLRGQTFFLLVFHCGAKSKPQAGQERLIEDTTGLLEWAAADRAIVRLTSMEHINANKEKLIEVIHKWLSAKS